MSSGDTQRKRGLTVGRAEPLRIVSIGGGSGLAVLLKGLKPYSHLTAGAAAPAVDLTAIVAVSDDGGSSGRLRREFDVLPPGDIRNCMVALAEDEALLTRLFRHRFGAGRGLRGHSIGNLLLTALTQITGDFATAVKLSSEVLAIAGRIYPATAENVRLRAYLANGAVVEGETRISRSRAAIRRVELNPRRCRPLAETLDAIRRADLITLGPGSLYTSVIPNLLVEGVAAAIQRSLAAKAYFVNLMWQPGETEGMSAADHAAAILQHAGRPVLEYAVVNTAEIGRSRERRYARQRARPVAVDRERLRALGLRVAGLPLLAAGEMARHDPASLARVAIQLAKQGRRRRVRAGAAVG